MLHDVAGQASGLLAAFDLLADPGAVSMHDEALALAEQSARALARNLALQRAVLSSGEPMSRSALEDAARRLFEGARGRLSLKISEEAPQPKAGRVLLGLLQVAKGGSAGADVSAALEGQVSEDRLLVSARGARARLRDEERRGLAGEGPGAGQPHRWALPYWLSGLIRQAGGSISVQVEEGGFSIEAHIARAID